MSEAITLRKTLIAAAVTAVAGGAFAAELGSLMVYSAVGEPLDAELTLSLIHISEPTRPY